MPTAVRISDELLRDARRYSKVEQRTLTGQIEHWARIGKCAEENPDLTYKFVKEVIIGIQELDEQGRGEYLFG